MRNYYLCEEVRPLKYMRFEQMPMVLSVDDIADTVAIGKNKAYNLVNSGQSKALKLGNHYRIPREAFIAFVRGDEPMAS